MLELLIPISIASAAAILFGRRRISRDREKSGFLPHAALWLGIVGVALSCWMGVALIHGLYNLGRVDSAIVTLRALVSAEAKFAETNPALGYTCKFSDLSSDPMLVGLMKSPEKNGYAFALQGCHSANGKNPSTQYQAVARPLHSGLQAFCADHSGILRTDYDGSVGKCLSGGSPVGG